MVLSLMACSPLASGMARLVTKPMYVELAAMLAVPVPSILASKWFCGPGSAADLEGSALFMWKTAMLHTFFDSMEYDQKLG